MAEPKYTYSFEGMLESLNGSNYTAIYLPADIIAKLSPKGRLRVKGIVNQTPISLAIQNTKEGGRFFMVGGILRRQAKIKLGSKLTVKFSLVDPNIVDIPEVLIECLAQDEEASEIFYKLTPGMQRSLSYYVTGVKNVDGQIKRALEMLDKAKRGDLYFQKNKKLT